MKRPSSHQARASTPPNQAAAPMIGLNHYIYLECIKATRAKVAKDDPTGIYASKSAPLVLAAN